MAEAEVVDGHNSKASRPAAVFRLVGFLVKGGP